MNYVSGSDGIPAEPFKILEDDAVEVLHSICQYLENSTMLHNWRRSVFTPISKDNAKGCSNYCTV